MLRIIPASPGGSASMPLPLSLYAEQEFFFELGISDELGSTHYEEYISNRLNLLNATFSIELLDHGPLSEYDPQADGQHWSDLAAVDGRFSIPRSLLPQHVYSWQVIAHVDDGGGRVFRIASEQLYIHTGGHDLLIVDGKAVSMPGLGHANGLGLAAFLQYSGLLSVENSLNGIRSYANFPLATDSYICKNISGQPVRPLPVVVSGDLLQLADILRLGPLMREAQELHDWTDSGRDSLGQLRSLSAGCSRILDSFPPSSSVGDMRRVASRLGREEALAREEKLSLLTELLLLGDKLVATGTFPAEPDTLKLLADYASVTEQRLRQLSDMDPALYNLLGSESGRHWQEFFRGQRAELALIRDDIAQQRLDAGAAGDVLRAARHRAALQLPEAFDGNETQEHAAACTAFAKLAPAGGSDALRDLLEAQLVWIAACVWPAID